MVNFFLVNQNLNNAYTFIFVIQKYPIQKWYAYSEKYTLRHKFQNIYNIEMINDKVHIFQKNCINYFINIFFVENESFIRCNVWIANLFIILNNILFYLMKMEYK